MMGISRRELLIGGAGALAGFALSPVPWKLLSDVSIWTQNFPWIPQPAHGPVETKYSTCTLCEGGCGIRVRMAAKNAVGVAGVRSHPLTQGALCPLAFAAHQLNWHPRRLREVRHAGRAASWAEAQAAFRKACDEGPVGIVDGRPGRAMSSVLEAFAQKHRGSYQVAPSAESQALAPYAGRSGVPVASLGYDLENARTIVSFGAPVLDGWGTPGRFTRLWSERAAGAADPKLRLIQIEPSLSRTAARAWQWVPLGEGSEAALAAGLARVLLEEHRVTAQGPMPQLPLAEAAARTGLAPEAICDLARKMVENRPVVVIATDANPAIAALNILLGAVAAPGGIVKKNGNVRPQLPAEPVPGALRAVLVDSTVPWESATQTDAEVFRFAAWDGGGEPAGWLLPAPGFLEELTDVPTPPTSARETYAVALNLLAPPTEVQGAAQFLRQIDPTLPAVDKVIHARCDRILHARQGAIYGEPPIAVAKVDSTDHLEEQLHKGAVWMDDAPSPGKFRCELKEWPMENHIARLTSWATDWVPPVLPPLAAKLYQESSLREPPAGRQA
jgi:anaerobic selenocysteine-containing dehydrogenase